MAEFSAAREVDTGPAPPRGACSAPRSCARKSGWPPCWGAASESNACETLMLRARADLDCRPQPRGRPTVAGRPRGAARRAARRALGPRPREGHGTLEARRHEVGELAERGPEGRPKRGRQVETLGDTRAICERVLRRLRVLGSALRPRIGVRDDRVEQGLGELVGLGQFDSLERRDSDHGQARGPRRGHTRWVNPPARSPTGRARRQVADRPLCKDRARASAPRLRGR